MVDDIETSSHATITQTRGGQKYPKNESNRLTELNQTKIN